MNISLASILARALANATPLIIAGVGGIFAERSGVVNIAIEGMMLTGGFAAAVGALYTGNTWLGLLIGILAGALVGLLHAYLCVSAGVNHVVSGLAINIFASSMSVYLMSVWFGNKGNTPEIPKLPTISIPYLRDLPLVGEMLGGLSIITLLMPLVVWGVWWAINRTPFGIRLLAAGENPKAAQVLGIRVSRVRYLSVALSGACAGLAGAYLSISFINMFVKNMVAGRGFIAIATIIFGAYKPLAVAVAGLLFGVFDAIQMAFQGTIAIPQEFTQSIPYIATIVAVAVMARKRKEV